MTPQTEAGRALPPNVRAEDVQADMNQGQGALCMVCFYEQHKEVRHKSANGAANHLRTVHPWYWSVRSLIEAEASAAAIERAKDTVLRREHEYLWTWDADKWTEQDMGHAAEMIGDFLGILDEEAAQ